MRHITAALLLTALLSGPALADPAEYTIEDYQKITLFEKERFEPSAAIFSEESGRLYFFNDKALDLMPTAWEWDAGGQLRSVPMPSAQWPIDKVEAATRDGDTWWVLTSCSKPPVAVARNWQLLALTEPQEGVHPEVVDYSVLLHAGLHTFLKERGIPWLKFEGLALSPSPGKLLLGVREFGLPPQPFDPDTADFPPTSRFVCGILEMDLNNWGAMEPLLWIEETCASHTGECFGLGSLELDPNGKTLWLTMNYEEFGGEKRSSVHGRLYEIGYHELGMRRPDEDLAQFLGVPVAVYEGKCEGLTFIAEDRLLLLFDQDDDRKGGPDSKKKFPLETHEDYILILDIPW